eukprot:g41220.t1
MVDVGKNRQSVSYTTPLLEVVVGGIESSAKGLFAGARALAKLSRLAAFFSAGNQRLEMEGSEVGEFVLSDAALGDGERGLLYGELEVCRPQSTVERTMLGYVPEGFHTTDLSHCEPLCNIVQAESEAARAAAWRQYSVLARQGQARGADGRRRALQDGGGVQHCPDGQDICACTAQESADHGCAQLSVAADRYQCCTRSSPMASSDYAAIVQLLRSIVHRALAQSACEAGGQQEVRGRAASYCQAKAKAERQAEKEEEERLHMATYMMRYDERVECAVEALGIRVVPGTAAQASNVEQSVCCPQGMDWLCMLVCKPGVGR